MKKDYKEIPLISLLYNVTNHTTIKAKFNVCEELIFDLFALSEKDKDIIRNGLNNDELIEKLKGEVEVLAKPGKVSMRVEGEISPTLGLIYNLLNNDQIKTDFIANSVVNNEEVSKEQYTFHDIAFHSFNVVEEESQKHFINLVSEENKDAAIDYLCEKMKKELKESL
ncbi:hypothetical protein CWB72_03245 [Pseudoalteromonas phenolica]|uniref:hypothetical protein n=1 Tax=Pseudoalteromonas phenolica TaxID=161398 RepID=UPI00110B0A32|nr:hypothetical protein [Pseudoalteromonas phenolica]TMN92919.1 hypothetical protein CWB72_03245 [Pseudoalteromonas phenolica]